MWVALDDSTRYVFHNAGEQNSLDPVDKIKLNFFVEFEEDFLRQTNVCMWFAWLSRINGARGSMHGVHLN
jgi:hypothetical protein